jgi:hypothetical protein
MKSSRRAGRQFAQRHFERRSEFPTRLPAFGPLSIE